MPLELKSAKYDLYMNQISIITGMMDVISQKYFHFD